MPEIRWGHDALEIVLSYDADQPLRAASLSNRRSVTLDLPAGPALVEVLTASEGRSMSSSRLVRTQVGTDLRHVDHRIETRNGLTTLRVFLEDPQTCLGVELVLESTAGASAFRARTSVTDLSGTGGQILLAAPSWSAGVGIDADDAVLVHGASDWLAEGRWSAERMRDGALVDLSLREHGKNARGAYSESSTGTWSTGRRLPHAAIVSAPLPSRSATVHQRPAAIAWQIEHNGPWRWEIGDDLAGIYLSLSGPTDLDHQWNMQLAPGETFHSVPVSIAIGESLDDVISELTTYRRQGRRPHRDNESLPVVFNDYMNTLMGDPTTEKLLPLISAASAVGAEVFCIDAGWYDDGDDWWDSVGEWLPSSTRFPRGLVEVTDRIHETGMIAGLWLEPEAVGVNSPLAARLPDSAFLRRHGRRIREHSRYHLDFSSPDARNHLDAVVDRLVSEFGIGYFKFDYNIDPGAGTDVEGLSVGEALLRHNRAYLAWIDGVLDRHPGLILENCSSGAMRMDQAMLERFQVQSTSDQQDFRMYPPIAAAAPLSMVPEQAANWAYPQPEMSLEQTAFCLAMAMLGRYYLSGHLNRMSPEQLRLVAEAVDAHTSLRSAIATSTPRWPLGLPGWSDPWVALALWNPPGEILATVWKRTSDTTPITLDLPELAGSQVEVDTMFPAELVPWSFAWNRPLGQLTVQADSPQWSARTIRIRRTGD